VDRFAVHAVFEKYLWCVLNGPAPKINVNKKMVRDEQSRQSNGESFFAETDAGEK
jgi:hypothetical protein